MSTGAFGAAGSGQGASMVSLDSVIASRSQPAARKPVASSYLELQGSTMMTITLVVICVVAVAYCVTWWFTRPTTADVASLYSTEAVTKQIASLASGPEPVKPEQLQAVLTAHPTGSGEQMAKSLDTLRTSHGTMLRESFQVVIGSGLLPIFTLLAGYVFGKRSDANSTSTP